MMYITLVTTSFNDEVHGTSNDKKTGCGINLLKPENVTRFRRGDRMKDLKEITCEKCKERIAKEIIRSDKKEMAKLMKEEKQRAKMGLSDEGIVPLGNTTAKITAAPEKQVSERAFKPEPFRSPFSDPEPEPNNVPEEEVVKIPGTNVAMDNTLSQFAINVPEEPEEEIVSEPETTDDFLAQFAVHDTEEAPAASAPVSPQNDFLAQFAIPAQPAQPQQPAPAPAPAMNGNQLPQGNDIMSMFAIGSQSNAPEQQNSYEAPQNNYGASQNNYGAQQNSYGAPQNNYGAQQNNYGAPQNNYGAQQAPQYNNAPVQEAAPAANEWDSVANQLFGYNNMTEANAPIAPTAPALSPDEPAEMAELAPAPVIDDIESAAAAAAATLGGYKAPTREEGNSISARAVAAVNALKQPLIDDINPSPYSNLGEDFGVREEEEIVPEYDETPVVEAAPVQPELPPLDYLEPVQPAAPVQQSTPVQQTAPIQPAQPKKPSVPRTVAKASEGEEPSGQIVSVPQFAGYDLDNNPVYTYIQMQISGYDENGQPILAPIPGQQAPVDLEFAQKSGAEIIDPEDIPYNRMTPGQRIAAAAAARGNVPATANISKIAVHEHTKATSQAFIHAISESKEYANQSLTDTQGMVQRSRVINSVEDVLSELGDSSAAIQRDQRAAAAAVAASKTVATPQYSEFKPKKPAQKSPYRPANTGGYNSTFNSSPYDNDYSRPMTKAEIKAQKKQEKIDAKFRKEMAKRGY
ncbi:hypothetical protein [Ruminococcus sp. XPD3002]|uniref:hypothetical protein n=1 Tax=Ruminococcus sp. XPD3002 TaxID=1452269 RepID=UPI0009116A5E|nr:hypothetical protein SAMN04487832_11182 [Ruminococcus flavefaciens]